MSKKLIILCLACIMMCSMVMPALAMDNKSEVTNMIIAGEGKGVSENIPTFPEPEPTKGSAPPPSSNATVTLGTYNGSIVWAGYIMFTDKWVKKNSTSIKLDANFQMYGTQQDAINQVNAYIMMKPNIGVHLVDKNGKKISKTVKLNDGPKTVTFNVEKNKDYYLQMDFPLGYFSSGTFKLY